MFGLGTRKEAPVLKMSTAVMNDAGRMKLVEGYCEEQEGRGPARAYFEIALERFTQAQLAEPSNPDYLLNMAEALLALGREKEAVCRLEEAKKLPGVNTQQLAGLTQRYSAEISAAAYKAPQLDEAVLPQSSDDGVKEDDPSTWPDWNSHPQQFRTG